MLRSDGIGLMLTLDLAGRSATSVEDGTLPLQVEEAVVGG